MPTSTPKLNREPFKAIKYIIKTGVVVAFFVFGLFWAFSGVLAGTTYYSTDFEDFSIGAVGGDEDWTGSCAITEVKSYSGTKSLYLNLSSNDAQLTIATSVPIGYLSFNIWASTGNSSYEVSMIYWTYPTGKVGVKILDEQLVSEVCGGSVAPLSPNVWHNVVVEWCRGDPECGENDHKYRFKVDNGEWSDWCFYVSLSAINLFRWRNNTGGGTTYIYIDDVVATDFMPGCNIENCGDCENWFSCGDVGCCWYETWWGWPAENECISCPTGDCGEGPLDCQNCLSTTTCALWENCYWANELCKFGTGECGPGLSCDFCYSSSTCIAQDCFWYDTYCWFSGPIEVSDWATYYAEHGDYPTSTAWIDGLASKTETMFNSLSGFLSGFVNAFDNEEAQAQGIYFGSIIPEARGHLNSLNMFFGELPVAQAFLFLITFLVAIGIFRLIRNIIALIKFW